MDATWNDLAAKVLVELRHRVALTQAELARLVGTSQAAIDAYEHGRRQPTLPMFCRLLAAAGASATIEVGPLDRRRADVATWRVSLAPVFRRAAAARTAASLTSPPSGVPEAATVQPPPSSWSAPKETYVTDSATASPLNRQQVLDLVRGQLADILEIEPDAINESSSFADDLNADSLALIELVESLEEELRESHAGFRIDDDDLEDLRTVRDAVDYVSAKLGAS